MNRIIYTGPAILLLLAIILTMLTGPQIASRIEWARTDARIDVIHGDLSQSHFLANLSQAFRHVAKAVEPSVVSIEVFFDTAPNDQAPHPGVRDMLRRGHGSGWVYDHQGHIVTNHHVIHGADRIVARFANGAEYEAELVNSDQATDIAVLRVPDRRLHPARIAVEPVRQGDMVFAFGSPLRFEFSMSQGVVSGMGRHLGSLHRAMGGYEWFIQTDASINPGNSGGPLTNVFGEVVGMNTAIASRDGTFQGIGFAIPVNLVRKVVDQIIANGQVRRGFLGIILPERDLDFQQARSVGLERQGVMIAELVDETGPAAQAGLQPGDIIIRINDEPIRSMEHLRFTVSTYAPGTHIELEFIRDNQRQTTTLALAQLPPDPRPFRLPARPRPDW